MKRFLILVILVVLLLFFLSFQSFTLPFQSSSSTTYALSSLQSDVEKTANNYQPIVVSIIATKDIPVITKCKGDPSKYFEQPSYGNLGEILRNCTIKKVKAPVSGGTAFAIDSSGILLTNKHVVADTQADYTVLFNDGQQDNITAIYRDPKTDVALVKINRTIPAVAQLGDSSNVHLGEFVVAMGNALGELQNSASFGIISGLHRNIIAGDQMGGNTEQLQQVFQTDAAINPGNSGGPLIDLNGQVIGMNTAAAAQGQNIGFAIPINTVKPILAQFMK